MRQTRERRRVSVAGLAAAMGVQEERIAALEAGRVDPTYEQLLALAHGLGVQLSELFILAEQLGPPSGPPRS